MTSFVSRRAHPPNKGLDNKDLQNQPQGRCTKTCTQDPQESQKRAKNLTQIDARNLPTDLAEIVAVWPTLPEHIKAAIKALVQTPAEGTE